MATTFVDYTGDGNATKSFSFPSYKVEDIKVEVDQVIKTVNTHYNITSYTTTGGGNVVFIDNSGSGGTNHIPQSPSAIRIFRDTDVDSAKATFTAGSSVKADDLNNNMTQILYAAQEEQNQTILTSDIKDSAVTTAKIKADNITSALIADDQINSEHYVDGSIDTAHIADAQITTAKLAADSVTNAKIADDSINSEHYVDGSIDTAHIANDAVTNAKIGAGAISTDLIAADAITSAKIADDQINSEHYVDGSIDTAHIADAQITTAKIVDANVTTAKIAADAVNGTKIADDSINSEHYVDGSIDTAHIADSQVTTAKIADANITAAKIASNAVTTDKIQDGELTTLAGMQSATASKLADSTALTADIADLNQIDGMAKQTTITDDDAKFPTSGAVVDYVAAQLEPFGGFEAIANEVSFPNTQPASGVAISIADAAGIEVDGSGSSTTGRTVGGTTVTINNINSQYNSSTVASGIRFIVTSTGSGQVYNYHKSTLPESDLVNLSGDINDFNERYRVGGSNPTSSLDAGDLFYNTGTNKLLVYNATDSAWEETQSVGNFFINTISSSSATGGGSATPNGTAYRFTLSNAGASAEQHLVSVDGVIQKPNSGTSQPSEGFAVDGADIILGSAPVNGASFFVITIGAAVGIGTPSNNTVTTAILQNGSVTTAKIVDANVTTAKITDANVTTAKIADDAVTAAKLASSAVVTASIVDANVTTAKIADANVTTAKIADDAVTAAKLANTSVTAASYGSATAIPVITVDAQGRITAASTAATTSDLVGDTSPQLGGDLDTNSHHIALDDDHAVRFGGNNDLSISHAAGGISSITHSHSGGEPLHIVSNGDIKLRVATSEEGIIAKSNGAVELYHNNSKKFETYAAGSLFTGNLKNTNDGADQAIYLGASDDLGLYHDGTDSYIDNATGNLNLRVASGETGVRIKRNDAVELYHNNTKMLSTESRGAIVQKADDVTFTVGSTNAGGVRLCLDGDSNGDSAGNDYAFLQHNISGNLIIAADNPSQNGEIIFCSGNANERARFDSSGHFTPFANNTYDLGSTSYRWANVYTNDLHLSNEGHTNSVDGTWGDWTIQEGESDLFLKNNRSGKKYKFNLTEVS